MKKSERYHMALLAVLDDGEIDAVEKLEIVETLMDNMKLAEWSEKKEEEKKAEESK